MTDWLKAALIRAVRTFSQVSISVIGPSMMLENVDWRVVVSSAALSSILSLLKSMTGLPEVSGEGKLTWAKAAMTRAVHTVAQAAITTIGTSAVLLENVDWRVVVSSALLAGILSLLTSTAGLPEVKGKGGIR